MKHLLVFVIIGLTLMVLCGCGVYSVVDLQNPEYPDDLLPSAVTGKLLEKYSVGDVIVTPHMFQGVTQEGEFALMVMFASKNKLCVPRVDNVEIAVNGVHVDYTFPLGASANGEWKTNPYDPFFVCGPVGPIIAPPGVVMAKSRVDLSLSVSVEDKIGVMTSKRIDCYFIPHKRFYVE